MESETVQNEKHKGAKPMKNEGITVQLQDRWTGSDGQRSIFEPTTDYFWSF